MSDKLTYFMTRVIILYDGGDMISRHQAYIIIFHSPQKPGMRSEKANIGNITPPRVDYIGVECYLLLQNHALCN